MGCAAKLTACCSSCAASRLSDAAASRWSEAVSVPYDSRELPAPCVVSCRTMPCRESAACHADRAAGDSSPLKAAAKRMDDACAGALPRLMKAAPWPAPAGCALPLSRPQQAAALQPPGCAVELARASPQHGPAPQTACAWAPRSQASPAAAPTPRRSWSVPSQLQPAPPAAAAA